ncbi:MAG: acetyl-CoA carboxylase biotin carboxylase subunit [Thermoplasmatota archaeon]
MFKKVLIANRGEIAVRVIRACNKMGIQSVAVYSDADKDALHVQLANEAVHIGPTPSAESYLVQENILQAAKDTGAEAIHPGYGFLSENADFARLVRDAGLVFIGPSPEAMDQMGDKVAARNNAIKAGVPVAPGSEALTGAEDAAKEAERIGYPVMLKASAGGGGIGMRVVRDPALIKSEFKACQDQAKSAFGVPDVFLEKFIGRPRHIEVQVLADQHGHAIHLYERECSVQRRNQKLVEEAPSPALTTEQREELGEKAVALAKLVGYSNAGTLEFLYEDGQFFFNEMNTRLQVEHPVTELVTGVDLVEWQLRIAAGEPLTLQQSDIQLKGHAFEARINAEDPFDGFRPSPGPVRGLRLPSGKGVRVDSGLYAGWTVPSAYDSMVCKLLTYAENRDADCERMRGALAELAIDGFTTNQAFHERLFQHPAFVTGDLTTRFLEEHDLMKGPDHATLETVAALAMALKDAPGGGLAGTQLAQRIPPVTKRGGPRNWEAA